MCVFSFVLSITSHPAEHDAAFPQYLYQVPATTVVRRHGIALSTLATALQGTSVVASRLWFVPTELVSVLIGYIIGTDNGRVLDADA